MMITKRTWTSFDPARPRHLHLLLPVRGWILSRMIRSDLLNAADELHKGEVAAIPELCECLTQQARGISAFGIRPDLARTVPEPRSMRVKIQPALNQISELGPFNGFFQEGVVGAGI
jgi:hypothetical protein